MTNDQLELIYPTRRANIDGDLSENRSKDLIKILVDHAFDLTLSAFTDNEKHTLRRLYFPVLPQETTHVWANSELNFICPKLGQIRRLLLHGSVTRTIGNIAHMWRW